MTDFMRIPAYQFFQPPMMPTDPMNLAGPGKGFASERTLQRWARTILGAGILFLCLSASAQTNPFSVKAKLEASIARSAQMRATNIATPVPTYTTPKDDGRKRFRVTCDVCGFQFIARPVGVTNAAVSTAADGSTTYTRRMEFRCPVKTCTNVMWRTYVVHRPAPSIQEVK